MEKRQIIILTSLFAIIIVIAAALQSGGNDDSKNEKHKARDIKYVKTRVAVITNHPLVINANGRIGSSRNVVLISEAQGKLLPGDVN